MPLMTPAAVAQAAQAALEEELRALQKKERELEGRLRVLDKGGKPRQPQNEESDSKGLKRSQPEDGDAEERHDDNDESRKRVKEEHGTRGKEESEDQPRMTSAVTRPERNLPQEKNPDLLNRNKRLFGRSLLGTLQQAKKETVSEKRKQIEESIDNKVKEERELQHKLLVEEKEKDSIALEEVRRMRQEKEKQLLEHKQKERDRVLSNFKLTTTKPSIYWRPKQKEEDKPPATEIAVAPTDGNGDANGETERPHSPHGEAPAEEPVTSNS